MNIFNKIKWVLAILGIFMIILATNLIDKNNFLRVEESVDNIYNERLLAKELLLEVTLKFHKKELAYALNDTTYLQSKNYLVNTQINTLLKIFDRSGSTEREVSILHDLNENHAKLIKLESSIQLKDTLYTLSCSDIFSAINMNIVELSIEQIKEGKNQKFLAKEAINMVKLFTKVEIYILLFLAVALQFIILYNPKIKPEEDYKN